MYVIVEIAGQQFKLGKDQKVFVHRLDANVGDKVSFGEVLLLEDAGKVTVGTPFISGAGVEAEVLRHLKGDKVIVFKKKRRKGYQKSNGHRQLFTELLVKNIIPSGFKSEKKAEEKKAAKPQPKVEKPEVKESKTEEKKVKAEAKPAAKETKKAETKPATESKPDDLKKIEGIGPKIASILVNAGIDTFAKLAEKDPEEIREILLKEGKRYASHNPATWPRQAKLAAEGKWEELKKWQDELDGGKE